MEPMVIIYRKIAFRTQVVRWFGLPLLPTTYIYTQNAFQQNRFGYSTFLNPVPDSIW